MTATILQFIPRPKKHNSIIPPFYYQIRLMKQCNEMALQFHLGAFLVTEYLMLAFLGQPPEKLESIRETTGALDSPTGRRLVARSESTQ